MIKQTIETIIEIAALGLFLAAIGIWAI